jgi:(2Fe-2S) ferredoxin
MPTVLHIQGSVDRLEKVDWYDPVCCNCCCKREPELAVDRQQLSAIYCGVPDANTAFRIAQAVLADEETTHQEGDR